MAHIDYIQATYIGKYCLTLSYIYVTLNNARANRKDYKGEYGRKIEDGELVYFSHISKKCKDQVVLIYKKQYYMITRFGINDRHFQVLGSDPLAEVLYGRE